MTEQIQRIFEEAKQNNVAMERIAELYGVSVNDIYESFALSDIGRLWNGKGFAGDAVIEIAFLLDGPIARAVEDIILDAQRVERKGLIH